MQGVATTLIDSTELRLTPERRSGAWVEHDADRAQLVVHVERGSWWLHVYGALGSPPRVDSEMAPYREVISAVRLHQALTLWALGG